MIRHLGYRATTQSIDACTSRICRADEASPERVRALIRDNLRDLARILHFNAGRGIALYRISSQIIPFASHPGNGIAWWDEFAGDLERIGQFVIRQGLRLEMHPGHHCLLNAPSPETVALSVLELGWHIRFLDAMQVDASHKLVIRIGGTFGDKAGSLGNFVRVIGGFPDAWKYRLVVENDESRFTLSDTLEAAEQVGLPVVFAFLSHQLNPGQDLDVPQRLARCLRSWKSQDGPAIVHLASLTRDRSRRAPEAEWIEPTDLETLLRLAPSDLAFDCLLEASQGDRALFDLRDRMNVREFGELPGGFDLAPLPLI